ncbi:helix-turn-helix domain-containing protein [Pseudoclavibacter sp. RFBB5]|uniref:helix-turn-helix domain-containing protein n=1 Tax=Pseudoclavibacter sp. RFBB5 TaxID=2080574 RepID=UPI000CE8B8AC|nr:helix-turn-helix domain-containing protein [Pseudoclavibacter sp. RFBB5]PPG31779.1 transcriptional regulator [Pseudoclavibacter sp. RFBB5]
MPDPRASEDDEQFAVTSLGLAVRAGRKRLDLSVHALAKQAGVSLGLVSQLERGIGNPSLGSIQRLATALGVPITQLLEPSAPDFAVVTHDRRLRLPTPTDVPEDERAVRELLTPRSESTLQLIRSVLPPRFTNAGRPFRHIGTESVTVLSGRLMVVHGEEEVVLGAGDTATYACSTAHWWSNEHDGETVVIGAVSPFER